MFVRRSATIDPTLFRNYFADETTGKPAAYEEVPGRSFPVTKSNLNDIFGSLRMSYEAGGWVFEDKDVAKYMDRELRGTLEKSVSEHTDDSLKLPAALVCLVIGYIAHKTRQTRDGHILGERG